MVSLIRHIASISCPAFVESRDFGALDVGKIAVRTSFHDSRSSSIRRDGDAGAQSAVNAEADPGALARVLTCFQTLNVVPRRVIAEAGTTGTLYIRIDVTGLTERHLSLIAAKIGQVPCVENAYWHRL